MSPHLYATIPLLVLQAPLLIWAVVNLRHASKNLAEARAHIENARKNNAEARANVEKAHKNNAEARAMYEQLRRIRAGQQ